MVLKRESSKSLSALPKPEDYPEVCQKNLDMFFRFLHKRHNIYIRRFIKKKPPPWTKDPILEKYKFTNVYRILDRGSQWMIKNIIENDKYPRLQDKVWACIFYRINNNIETFEACGIPLRKKFNPEKYEKRLNSYKSKGFRVFTNAHITCQSNLKQSRIANFITIVTKLKKNWKYIWKEIKKFRKILDWEGCFKFFLKQYGFGGFTSYEVCIDMVYAGVFPDKVRDTFANPGPGCEFGIETIYPNRECISYTDAMSELTDEQDEHFEHLGIKFKGPRLTLQDMEFCLCEWGKYWKIKKQVGKARMHFHPITKV